MTNEKFKELFGENEPIKNWETERGMFDLPVRIIDEDLYRKMIVEIESKPMAINEQSAKSIIDMATENAELKQSIFDLYLYIQEAKKGNKHVAKKCGNELMYSIFIDLMDNFEAIRDNFKQHKPK